MTFGKKSPNQKGVEEDDGVVPIGIMMVEVHAGRFHMKGGSILYGDYHVEGDDLEDLAYDIDYERTRKTLILALRDLADECETNPELITLIEED